MISTSEQESRATRLEQLARLTTQFFLSADNLDSSSLFDLDPRAGYVRLGQTKANGQLGLEIQQVQGLMNPNRELQAVLSSRGVDSVFTISGLGREISVSCCRGNSLTFESLILGDDGAKRYTREESEAC